jgi:MoaA/NifB/PqqE/SkfB family radical SAM enzyme
MTQEVIDTFVKRKPDFIAITLYGSNNQTYQQITKNPKGFDMVHQSIQLLKNNNIPVMLRTIPIRPIVDEMDELISYAKHQKLPLGYALYVGPTRDLCHKELGLRLKPLELIEFERKMRVNYGLEAEPDFLESSSNTTCAALKSGFYIDYRFHMMPCAMLNHPKQSVTPQTFIQTFHELGDIFTSLNHCNDCSTCDSKSSCIQCYARRFLEGDAHTCHPYLKAIAKLRKGDHHETN